jgi:hypothetical protein
MVKGRFQAVADALRGALAGDQTVDDDPDVPVCGEGGVRIGKISDGMRPAGDDHPAEPVPPQAGEVEPVV